MSLLNNLLAIDPGLHLGYAFFPEGKQFPTKVGLVNPKIKGKDFFVNFRSTVAQYGKLLVKFPPGDIAIEWPLFYNSAGGAAAAGSGSVVKLAFEIGKLVQVAEAYGWHFIPVPVNEWKGQLPKKIVIKRIQKKLSVPRLRQLNPQKDAWDAIGIGLFMRGLFQ